MCIHRNTYASIFNIDNLYVYLKHTYILYIYDIMYWFLLIFTEVLVKLSFIVLTHLAGATLHWWQRPLTFQLRIKEWRSRRNSCVYPGNIPVPVLGRVATFGRGIAVPNVTLQSLLGTCNSKLMLYTCILHVGSQYQSIFVVIIIPLHIVMRCILKRLHNY